MLSGETDPETAELLSIGRCTAESHVSTLLAKLGIETRVATTAVAVQGGRA